MSKKRVYTYEEKEKIFGEYKSGVYGFLELCRIYRLPKQTLKNWIRLYETFGLEGFKASPSDSSYSKETKQAAVLDYLLHKLSVKKILVKYRIRSDAQLRRWVKKYNSHEPLTAFATGGTKIMTKGRKTTFDERVEIVQYCIAHEHNYADTAVKYGISYQQARSYVTKYEKGGVEALRDRRGKPKPVEEMSELEKLRAENRILRAEKRKVEMELSFLKKLDELERRRG